MMRGHVVCRVPTLIIIIIHPSRRQRAARQFLSRDCGDSAAKQHGGGVGGFSFLSPFSSALFFLSLLMASNIFPITTLLHRLTLPIISLTPFCLPLAWRRHRCRRSRRLYGHRRRASGVWSMSRTWEESAGLNIHNVYYYVAPLLLLCRNKSRSAILCGGRRRSFPLPPSLS